LEAAVDVVPGRRAEVGREPPIADVQLLAWLGYSRLLADWQSWPTARAGD